MRPVPGPTPVQKVAVLHLKAVGCTFAGLFLGVFSEWTESRRASAGSDFQLVLPKEGSSTELLFGFIFSFLLLSSCLFSLILGRSHQTGVNFPTSLVSIIYLTPYKAKRRVFGREPPGRYSADSRSGAASAIFNQVTGANTDLIAREFEL